jgi:OOP family OmpA-OmpF porin
MQEVADAGQCGGMVLGDSISTPAGMAAFVEKVFLETKREEPGKVIASPPPRMEGMKEGVIEKGRSALLVDFDFDKAVVKQKYHQEIEKLADIMKKYPDLNIVVEGHTCNIGPAKYNQKLSQRRAEAIKEVMVKKFNINAARITAKGYGLSKPIASNATKEGRQQNRRVEAVAEYMKK